MDEVNKLDQIARYLSGEMNTEEQKAFRDWIQKDETNQTFYEETVAIWEMTEKYKEETFDIEVNDSWNRFEQKLEKEVIIETPIVSMKSSNNFKQLLKIAAVLLVGLGISYLVFQPKGADSPMQMVIHQTMQEEKTEVTLPDGTKVWLNKETKLTYKSDFKPRQVFLEGEAFFEVMHQNGASFEIESGDTKTMVLGTAFNVRAYPEEDFVAVTVEEGKVAFEDKKSVNKSVILTAGDAAIFDESKKTLSKSIAADPNTNAWKTQKLIFNNTAVAEVIPTLERYFDKKIKVANPKIMNCHMTGQYEQPTLSDLLEVLAFSLDLKVENENNYIILSGEGCDN